MAISQNSRPLTSNPEAYIQRTVRESQKLDRLVSLNAHLSGVSKIKDLSQYIGEENLKKSLLQRSTNLQSLISYFEKNPNANIEEARQALAKKVDTVALSYLEKIPTNDPHRLGQLIRDLKAIEANPPLTRTVRGVNGPTFILSVPIWISFGESEDPKKTPGVSAILKWTSHAEVTAHRFYEAFITEFLYKKNNNDHRFCFVPKLTCIDLDKGLILERKRTFPLNANARESIEKSLTQTVRNYQVPGLKFSPVTKILARLEKVSGKNFPDFAQVDYPELPIETKKSLFRRLGKIGFLDFVFGNTDRLFKLDWEEVKLSDDDESNLDNLMVERQGDLVAIFVIDNGIDDKLAEPESRETYRQDYLSLIQRSLSNEKFPDILSGHIVARIEARMKEVPNSKAFQKDLLDFGKRNIQLGIEVMKTKFSSDLYPKCNVRNKTSITDQFSDLDPEISNVIWERIETTQKAINSPSMAPNPLGLYLNDSFGNPDLSPTKDQNSPPRMLCLSFLGALSPESRVAPSPANYSFYDLEGSPSKWVIEPSRSIENFLWGITNHCKGTREDELFFETATPPQLTAHQLENPTLSSILGLFHELKSTHEKVARFEKMQALNNLIRQNVSIREIDPAESQSPWHAPSPSPLLDVGSFGSPDMQLQAIVPSQAFSTPSRHQDPHVLQTPPTQPRSLQARQEPSLFLEPQTPPRSEDMKYSIPPPFQLLNSLRQKLGS